MPIDLTRKFGISQGSSANLIKRFKNKEINMDSSKEVNDASNS